jgi:hypothetical protein
VRATHHFTGEALRIQTESRGVLGEALVTERILILK